MKTVVAAAFVSLALSAAAQAAPFKTQSPADTAGCGVRGMNRTALTLGAPETCCVDHLRCTQLLSTTIIELPRLSPRT